VYKVCIVGGGQIGSRHLQGLASVNVPIEIFVVDPSPDSLEVARQRFQEVKGQGFVRDVHYIQDITLLPVSLDLCIVATSSHVRFGIMDYLTSSHKVHNYILEKVVFQSSKQFDEMLTRIAAQGSYAWVNCARRMYPGYHELKKLFEGEKTLKIKIAGGDWSLGCNAIHYLDLFAYLSGESHLTIDASCLEPRIYRSKREGYAEFSGTISGTVRGRNEIVLTSQVGSVEATEIVFRSENITAIVDEAGRTVELSSNGQGRAQTLPFESLFQSQLTHIFVQDILKSGTCSLSTLEESAAIHKPLIEALLRHMNQYDDKLHDHCPIT